MRMNDNAQTDDRQFERYQEGKKTKVLIQFSKGKKQPRTDLMYIKIDAISVNVHFNNRYEKDTPTASFVHTSANRFW